MKCDNNNDGTNVRQGATVTERKSAGDGRKQSTGGDKERQNEGERESMKEGEGSWCDWVTVMNSMG